MRIRWAASAAIVLGALALAPPARAQFGSLREAGVVPTVTVGGKISVFKPVTLFVSPYTLFQRTFATVNGGQIFSVKTNEAGPMVLLEKIYRLDLRESYLKAHPQGTGSTFSFGGWYWYHSSKIDRLAVYGKYFPNGKLGVQLSLGGDTHLGLSEYYGFLLYNALRTSPTNKLAIQLGVGPYLPRSSLGNSGYTATAAAAYTLSPELTVNASLWYINFKQKFPQFGFNKTSTTIRYTVGVGYAF